MSGSNQDWHITAEELPPTGDDVLGYWPLAGEMHVVCYWTDEKMWRRHMDHEYWDAPDAWMALPIPPEKVVERV